MNQTPSQRSEFRRWLESWSYPLLRRLTTAPRWLVALTTLAVLLGGLFAPRPWGPLLLALVVMFFTWLVVLSWPRLTTGARAARLAVVLGFCLILIVDGWQLI